MSTIRVEAAPPSCWDVRCADERMGLFGPAWRRVLSDGLGVRFGFCTRDEQPEALAIVFRRGPFRLAYADFPSGALCPGPDLLDAISFWSKQGRAAALRYAYEADASDEAAVLTRLPVTRIEDLQAWSERSHEKAARSASRTRRSMLELRAARNSDAAFIARSYDDTVRRQKGSLKYPRRYFDALVEAAAADPDIRCELAECGGVPLAFHCSIRHRDTTFYLHGGSSATGRRQYASDLLMLDSIRHAKRAGCIRYDFLQSPIGQQGLLRYKRAWGGVTAYQQTSERVLAPVQHRILRAVMAAAARLAALRQSLQRQRSLANDE